jgi:hypothetical protein
MVCGAADRLRILSFSVALAHSHRVTPICQQNWQQPSQNHKMSARYTMKTCSFPFTGLQTGPKVRILFAPPDSLDRREFPSEFSWKYADYAHFPRFPIDKLDCGERTLLPLSRITMAFFSGAPLTSPTLHRP